jgi:nicotinamide mononucleotide adenylyltransferase|tara:strand:- start:54 stop:464 length:411 start_codon:yes stop_codon:yes gene_type:complete
MFDWKKPTAQMLGRWQPWHDGHTELFKRALAETGQVCIMIRDVGGIVGEDAGGGRTVVQDDNPFSFDYVVDGIEEGLHNAGFTRGNEYVTMQVPNIVDISYGRGVGYTFTEHDLGKEIHSISATQIRNRLRDEGKL